MFSYLSFFLFLFFFKHDRSTRHEIIDVGAAEQGALRFANYVSPSLARLAGRERKKKISRQRPRFRIRSVLIVVTPPGTPILSVGSPMIGMMISSIPDAKSLVLFLDLGMSRCWIEMELLVKWIVAKNLYERISYPPLISLAIKNIKHSGKSRDPINLAILASSCEQSFDNS